MSERWRKELARLDEVSPSDGLLDRVHTGPQRGEPAPRLRQRVVVAAVALCIAGLAIGIAFAAFGGMRGAVPTATPGGPTSSPPLGLWPERTAAEVAETQASVDAGDGSLAWRTNPKEVARHFVIDVMGWQADMGDVPGLIVDVVNDDSPCCTYRVTRMAHSWPYPGPPWWMSAPEEISVRQLASPGAQGIWTVTQVRAPQLGLPYTAGDEVPTDGSLLGSVDSREDHFTLGGEGGSACSQGQVVEVKGPNTGTPDLARTTGKVGFFRDPKCGKTGDGYVTLVAGAYPFEDPFGGVSPGDLRNRYIPAMSAVPVRFVEGDGSMSVAPPPQPFFPTTPNGPSGDQALYNGPVMERDGCVFLGGAGVDGYALPLWPKGYSAERNADGFLEIRDDHGAVVATAPGTIRMGGGYTAEFQPAGKVDPRSDQIAALTDWLGYAIPERCLGPDVYGAWVVGEIEGTSTPSSPPAGAGAWVANITCTDEGTVLEDAEVNAQRDGVHLDVRNETQSDLGIAFDGYGGDNTGKIVWQFAPGKLRLRCSNDATWHVLQVSDPEHYWVSPALECPPGAGGAQGLSDPAPDATGEKGDPVDLVRAMPRVQPTDVVERAGYPEQPGPEVRVVRDGKVVMVFGFTPDHHGGWFMTTQEACST